MNDKERLKLYTEQKNKSSYHSKGDNMLINTLILAFLVVYGAVIYVLGVIVGLVYL